MKLIDASALYELITKGEHEALMDAYILDLTIYEFGNALWKQHTKLKSISKEEHRKLLENFDKLIIRIIRISKEELGEISETSVRYDLTTYDSAYLIYAKKYSLELLTEDKKLLEAWKKERK